MVMDAHPAYDRTATKSRSWRGHVFFATDIGFEVWPAGVQEEGRVRV